MAAPHSSPTTAQQEQGMGPGSPLADPAVAEAGAGGADIAQDADKARFSVSGKEVWGQAYNGPLVAPTLRLDPGTTTTVTLHNRLPVATSLHFHGLHASPEGSSDNPFVCIPPGASFTYRLQLPADHPQGTFWYHSHAMGTSCPAPSGSGGGHVHAMPSASSAPGDVENQIFAGLSGTVVVGDSRTPHRADGPDPAAALPLRRPPRQGGYRRLNTNTGFPNGTHPAPRRGGAQAAREERFRSLPAQAGPTASLTST